MVREFNFDGLAGPTHNYAGLSPGNLASAKHAGEVANPRAAALQGLEKMRFVSSLGIGQAVLPPEPRPDVGALRMLGFSGDDAAVLSAAAQGDAHLLRLVSSASAMWTANAATVAPSSDTADRRVHLTVANLSSMFHRSIEASNTLTALRAIFRSGQHFVVHDPVPAFFGDEGAANHTRLGSTSGTTHLFGWGRDARAQSGPRKFPARQSREASEAVARLHQLGERALVWQQSPRGIDAGAFHTDVLAVGNDNVLLLHEFAFADPDALCAELERRLGSELVVVRVTERDLPVEDAVAAYPFNSQLVTLASGKMAIVAPTEAQKNTRTKSYLDRVVSESNLIDAVHFIDVNASMGNGGGPACLRLRVRLTDEERAAVNARVFFDDELHRELKTWIESHYRDRITLGDLSDVSLLDEVRTALDELTGLLCLGSIYDFQQSP